jgi:anti-anti-sigma factor
MSSVNRAFVASDQLHQSRGVEDIIRSRSSQGSSLAGPIRPPLTAELRHRILEQLRRGERISVLDLSRVWSIDAAGVGQLVRAYDVTRAAHGTLRIVHTTRRVRALLERSGLFKLLSTHHSAV